MLDEPELGLAGLQYVTFNQLAAAWEWHRMKREASGKSPYRRPTRAGFMQREETSA
jgi:hypothetical protein